MISVIENLPPHVIGLHISGKIAKDDYKQVLEPAIQQQENEFDKLNCLIVYDTEMQHFSLGALLEDLKTDFKYYNKWNRVALVTTKDYLKKVTGLISSVIPGQLKGFEPSEIEEAKAWVGQFD
ncbi:MAG TPA: STAS/SEC14 domain-containing protein [Pelobium sp.]|nr:STAS/SEC14 domain-containing protein [Pelobium sp.]